MTTLATLAAFLRRDWAVARTYRFGLVIAGMNQVFQLSTFFFLAKMVDPSASSGIDEGGYFRYVVAGLVLLGLASTGLTAFAYTIQGERFTGSLEAMITTPTPPALLVVGMASYSICTAVLSSLAMLGAAIALFGFRIHATPTTAVVGVVAFLATVVWVAGIGILVAAFSLVVQRGSSLLGFVASGLSLFGGVYFTVDTLPRPLEALAQVFPFAWGLQIVRDSLDGERADPRLLGLLIAVAAATLPAALRVFERALEHVRRTGTLSHF